jgi:hypothetical protein
MFGLIKNQPKTNLPLLSPIFKVTNKSIFLIDQKSKGMFGLCP